MFPLSVNNYAEIGAFLVSAFTWKKFRDTPFRLFPFFLFFIVLVELFGRYIKYDLRYRNNAWLYNISTTVEFVFYAFIFSKTLKDRNYRKIPRLFMIFYPVLVFLNCWLVQGFTNWHSHTMALGSVCTIIFCCLFFYELLMNPVEEELRRDPMFWICTGILFFYLGGLAYELLYSLIVRNSSDMGRKLFQSINNNLILMLYSCFVIGFLCKRTIPRSLSQ